MWKIFCKATTDGDPLALSGTAGAGDNIGYNGQTATTQVASSGEYSVLTIVLAGSSTAGSQIVVECNSELKINPSTGQIVSYKLESTDSSNAVENKPLLNRFGWKAT